MSACSEKSQEETKSASEETTIEPETTSGAEPEEVHWEKAHCVDEFGDESEEWYLRGTFHGNFSNTATSGSSLTAVLFFDKNLNTTYDVVSIRLLEYDSHVANVSRYNEEDITIKIKIDGEMYEGKPYLIRGDDIVIK